MQDAHRKIWDKILTWTSQRVAELLRMNIGCFVTQQSIVRLTRRCRMGGRHLFWLFKETACWFPSLSFWPKNWTQTMPFHKACFARSASSFLRHRSPSALEKTLASLTYIHTQEIFSFAPVFRESTAEKSQQLARKWGDPLMTMESGRQTRVAKRNST